ncbi:hypothetical protein ACQUHW_02840 [Pseudomonas aeruginosa]|uniref:hypothetical protein n=1 Tax=Pseudomonas TaxID=286 RepID=UPI0013C520DB|nr:MULTISPECIES: hypothetical protein [Pseudomonas]
MDLLATIDNLMASIVQPPKPLYTTVVYPTQGKAVVPHDGLKIRSERMAIVMGEEHGPV